MKLNIYEKNNVVKTYEAETYDLMMGTVEDFIALIKVDELTTGDDAEILKLAMGVVITGFDDIKNLLKDVFDGVTDEELRCVKVKEVALVLLDIIKYSLTEMGKNVSSKN